MNSVKAILLVHVALSRIGDFLAIGGLQIPTPLSGVVTVDEVTHMAPQSDFRTYLFEYRHDGSLWSIAIKASSPEDAKERMQKMCFARLLGEVHATIPARIGPVARAYTRLLNALNWKSSRKRDASHT